VLGMGVGLLFIYLIGSAIFRAFDTTERDMINNMLPKPVFVF